MSHGKHRAMVGFSIFGKVGVTDCSADVSVYSSKPLGQQSLRDIPRATPDKLLIAFNVGQRYALTSIGTSPHRLLCHAFRGSPIAHAPH